MNDETRNRYERQVLRVLSHIEANPDGDMSLDTLAEVAGMSRFHWHRVFTAMTGHTAAAAVRMARLNRAAADLVQGEQPVTAIARRAGYASHRSFARAFRAAYGQTPAAFRADGRALPDAFQTATEGDYPMYPIETRTDPDHRLAAVPHKGAYTEIGTAFDRISTIAAARGLWPVAKGMVGVYYDDPDAVAEADLTSHAGLWLPDEADLPEGVDEVRIPGGRVAVMHFKGPYSGLSAAYKHLYGVWLPTSGEEPRDAPAYEVYLNSPRDTAPEALLTDVCVPIR